MCSLGWISIVLVVVVWCVSQIPSLRAVVEARRRWFGLETKEHVS
jgi:hypothetical protein